MGVIAGPSVCEGRDGTWLRDQAFACGGDWGSALPGRRDQGDVCVNPEEIAAIVSFLIFGLFRHKKWSREKASGVVKFALRCGH